MQFSEKRNVIVLFVLFLILAGIAVYFLLARCKNSCILAEVLVFPGMHGATGCNPDRQSGNYRVYLNGFTRIFGSRQSFLCALASLV